MTNFINDCLRGDALITEVNDYIDYWHDTETLEIPLHEFLGMTKKEYELFVLEENYLGIIITAHKEHKHIDLLVQKENEYNFAARSKDSQKAKAIEAWLKNEDLW